MALVGAVRAILLADDAIASMVADRVRPLYGAQLDTRPFLTIAVTNNQSTLTHSGPSGSNNAVVEIGILTDVYGDADALAGHIERVFDGYRGTANGIRIAPAQYDDESDIEQTTQPGQSKPVFLKTVSYKTRYVNQPST